MSDNPTPKMLPSVDSHYWVPPLEAMSENATTICLHSHRRRIAVQSCRFIRTRLSRNPSPA